MKKIFYVFFLVITVCFSLAAQSLTTVILPQYIEGVNPTNINRIPFAYRVRITGLTASVTYRYYNQIVISSDAATASGAGNCIYTSATGDFIRTTGIGLSTAGTYGTFTTDVAGTYEGWFITEPTGNKRFVPGNYIFMRIMLNDGAGGTLVITRLTTTDSVRVVKLDPTITDSTGTGLRCMSSWSAKDFVFAYDNTAGTGRPISGSFIESDGTANTTANNYASFYGTNVDGVNGAFGFVLPNSLPNGIRRFERRSFTTGAILDSAQDNDGMWPSGINTVNPSGGVTEIVLAGTDLLTYSLMVNVTHGTVTKIPDQPIYQYGTSVQLIPIPDSSYHFLIWSGDVPTGHETDSILTVTMNQNRTITAIFVLATYVPTLTSPTFANITSTSALLGAKVISDGSDTITERGVVWSTSASPTIADKKDSTSGTIGVYTVMVDSLPAGTLIHFRGYAINGVGTAYSSDATFYTLSTEPSTLVSSFTAHAVSSSQINLSWSVDSEATGYIILQRIGSSDPTGLPTDATSYVVGDTIGDGKVIAVIPSDSTTSVSIAGLLAVTSYHYSIFPFAWNGANVATYNYKTDTVSTASTITLEGPQLTVMILPKYIEGVDGKNNTDRIPYAYRVKLAGLLTNATYRFINQVVISSDTASADGAGNCIFVSMTSDFIRASSPSLATDGAYGTFKTDSAGTYSGWFITEPTGNERFVPGSYIFMRIMLNDGASGTTVVTRLTTADSVRVVKLASSFTDSTGTGLRCTSAANPKDFVFLYDNRAGSGRPISGSFIENDGTDNTVDNKYAAFYANHVDGVDGAFGVVVPNKLSNGIRRLERRSLATGAIVVYATDVDGIWPSGANTINPAGGEIEIVLTETDVQWTTGVESLGTIPKEYALFQNYPNPFNPTTTISFSLPKESYVTLEVFNLIGKRIATLVNERRAAGNYSVTFNASGFSSGVYYYKISAGKFVNVRKLILLK